MKTGLMIPIPKRIGWYSIAFRLEPRARLEEINEGLRARIHDPLWMLGRQMQFGEFHGEDAALPVKVEFEVESRRPDRYRLGPNNGDQQIGWLDGEDGSSAPLEAVIEAESLHWDAYLRARVGMYFEQHLPENMRPLVRTAFPFTKPTELELAQQSRTARQFLLAMNGLVVDAEMLFRQVVRNGSASAAYEEQTGETLNVLEQTSLNRAYQSTSEWFGTLYYSAQGKAWQHERAEYCAGIAAPSPSSQHVLEAQEYYDGDLDWHVFWADGREGAGIETPETQSPSPQIPENGHGPVLPTGIQLPGMPHERWWEFEDGSVNLTKIDMLPEHLGKILMIEFALLFSNDWFLFPVSLPRGSLTQVVHCTVHDSFGGKHQLHPIDNRFDAPWTMFALSQRLENGKTGHINNRLYLPARTVGRMESKAIETVHFQRDEMGNLVWATERIITDALGRPADAAIIANGAVEHLLNEYRIAVQDVVDRWREALQTGEQDPEIKRMAQIARQAVTEYVSRGGQRNDIANAPPLDDILLLRYQLADFPPRNSFPFVPVLRTVRTPEGPKELMLQRHAIPDRLMSSSETLAPVRPQGLLIDGDIIPFYMYEEEVPKVGIRLTRSYQYARGADGKPYLWIGRRKQPGRPERTIGISWDDLRPNNR